MYGFWSCVFWQPECGAVRGLDGSADRSAPEAGRGLPRDPRASMEPPSPFPALSLGGCKEGVCFGHGGAPETTQTAGGAVPSGLVGARGPGPALRGSRARPRLHGEGGQKAGVHVGAMTQHLPPEPGAAASRALAPPSRTPGLFSGFERSRGLGCGRGGRAGRRARPGRERRLMAAERLLSSFLALLPGSREPAPGSGRPRGRAWARHLAPPAGARGVGGSFGGLAPPGRRARVPRLLAFACSGRGGQTGAISRAACGSGGGGGRAGRAEESRGEQAWLGDPPPRATRRGPACPPPRRRPIRHEEASLAGGPLALLVLPGGSQWQETSRPAGASTWPRPPSPASP